MIRDISLLVMSEGLRVVLQAMSDGPHDFSPILATCFLGIIDHPELRRWLRPGVDIEVRCSPALSKFYGWFLIERDDETNRLYFRGSRKCKGKGAGWRSGSKRVRPSSKLSSSLGVVRSNYSFTLHSLRQQLSRSELRCTGLMYLNIHGRQALTSLVDSLTNPSRLIRVRPPLRQPTH